MVWTGEAFKAVLADMVFERGVAGREFTDAQHVAAVRADLETVSCRSVAEGNICLHSNMTSGVVSVNWPREEESKS